MSSFQTGVDFKGRDRRRDPNGRRLADVLARPKPSTTSFELGRPATAPSEPATEPVAEPEATAPVPDDLAGEALLFDEPALASMLAAAAADARGVALLDAQASLEATVAATEATIAKALASEVAERRQRCHGDAALVLTLVEAIARHVIPKAIAAHPALDLTEALEALMARLRPVEAIEIKVHEGLEEFLTERLDAIAQAAAFDGAIQLSGDAGLAAGAAVVRWPDGEARHSPDNLAAEAVALCASWLAERDTPEPDPMPTTPDRQEPADEH